MTDEDLFAERRKSAELRKEFSARFSLDQEVMIQLDITKLVKDNTVVDGKSVTVFGDQPQTSYIGSVRAKVVAVKFTNYGQVLYDVEIWSGMEYDIPLESIHSFCVLPLSSSVKEFIPKV